MEELVAAVVTTLDILVIYVFLQVKKRKVVLALWTALLNVFIPLIGFLLGELSTTLFTVWSSSLSSVLLGLIGLHMLLQDSNISVKTLQIHPVFIAFIVSIDAFSVSVTLGMLQLNKWIFLVASGFFALMFSLVALYFQRRIGLKNGTWIRRIAGISLIIIGILSIIR